MSSSSMDEAVRVRILTNHNRLFFLHSTVIGQFLILTASSILVLLIVDDALWYFSTLRLKFQVLKWRP